MPEYPIHTTSLPEARIMADLIGVHNDLKLVMDILTRWLTIQNETVLAHALFSAAHITYRRCFNSGVRNGLTRDDIANIPNNAVELHDYLIAQANKLIAHSVNPFEQTQIGILVIEDMVRGVATLNTRLSSLKEPDIIQWGSLVKIIANTILVPRIEQARQAVDTAAKALPIAEIKKGQVLGYTAPGPDQANKRRD
jgi:hypothetical protein